MSKTQNINQNAIQVIFPSDMELRRVKKKRKPSGSSSKKKELIAELKELLQTYDNEIAVAKEKKVTLPADLGELPKNINEVKSIKQLELLIDELKSKILKIQELIKNATTSSRANELFGVAPRPQGIGTFPMLPPQTPAPIQPQIIQPPQIIPSRITPVRPDNNVGQKLDALEAEILKNLDPNDPATKSIIEQINKRKAEEAKKPPVVVPGTVIPGTVVPGVPVQPGTVIPGQPVTPGQQPVTPITPQPVTPQPVDPSRPLPPTPLPEDLKLEKETGDLIGISGKRLTLSAPISGNNASWFEINDAFRRYGENVEYNAQQLRPGEYHIPIDKLNEANETRQQLLTRYNAWLGNLSVAQRNYVDTNQLLRVANQQMFNQLNETPDELLRIILTRKGVKIIGITSGDTPSDIQKILEKKGLDKEGNKYAELLKKKKALYEKELNDIENVAKPETREELLKRQLNLEDDFGEVQTKNSTIKAVNRVGNEILYEDVRNVYNAIQKELNRLINESPRTERPPASPVIDPARPSPLPPSDADKPAPPKPDLIPIPPLVIGEGSNADIRSLILFVDQRPENLNWTVQKQAAYDRLFPGKKLPKASYKKRDTLRPMIQEWLRNNPQPS